MAKEVTGMTTVQQQTNIADISQRKTLRTIARMVEQGLLVDVLDDEAFSDLEKQYAIAMTSPMVQAGKQSKAVHKQFVPSVMELSVHPLENEDPIGDETHSPVPGIVHRHPDRILMMPTMACAVYCRFCFRREKVGSNAAGAFDAVAAMNYIHAHSEIKEVIFTGGDPLVLSANNLKYLLDGLDSVPHVQRIRFHSRVPVVAPYLMDEGKIAVLARARKQLWLSIHINSWDEMTDDALSVVERLRRAGVPMVSQSVLLRGVNDDERALCTLFDNLLNIGIKPYYVHHMDRAVGTSHFRVSLEKGLDLMEQVRRRVSGLAIPRYVLDIPGGVEYKVSLSRNNVKHIKDGVYAITTEGGKTYSYQDITAD